MLSYRHSYHAGNHADVLKHSVLTLCLEALQRKPGPLLLLDTHAGRGLYDLDSAPARQTGEAQAGIGRLWPQHAALLPASYREALREYNGDGPLRRYPGSCALLARARRKQDHALFCERHREEYAALEARYGERPGLRLHAGDGYAQLKAALPPASGRGLVLIDPSYETEADWRAVASAGQLLRKRFRAGVLLVWYPLLPPARTLLGALRALCTQGVSGWQAELTIRLPGGPGLAGSGMFVLNPPWQVDTLLQAEMPKIAAQLALAPGAGFRLQQHG